MNKQFKSVLLISFILITIILLVFSCESNKKYQQLKGQYDILNTEYRKQQNTVKEVSEHRKKFQDSISNVIADRDKKIAESNKYIDEVEKKIENIKKKNIQVPKDVPGLVDYFNSRYSTNENKISEDKVGLTGDTAYKVSYELEEKDNLNEIVILQDKQLNLKDTIIVSLKDNNENLNSLLILSEKEITEREKLQELSDKNIQNLDQQVKKLNRKNTVNKILIPVGIAVGGFVGYKMAK